MAKLYVFVQRLNNTDDPDDDVLFLTNEPPVLNDTQQLEVAEGALHIVHGLYSVGYDDSLYDDSDVLKRILVIMNITTETLSPAVLKGKEYLIINFSFAGTVAAAKAKRNKCPCCGK